MQNDPYLILFGVFVALWLGAKSWRHKRLKRAVRDLPTAMRRLLGPEPDFTPPPADRLPEGLAEFARLYRRTNLIRRGIRWIAGLWLIYAVLLVLRKQFL
jgi:threonine/homoserine/homoserine lactone efflux protein